MEMLIPLSAILLPAIIIGIVFHYRSKNKREILETVRVAAQGGTELTPEIIRALGVKDRRRGSETRSGIIWIAVALACIVFGWSIGQYEEEAFRAFIGFAAFPGLIGLALIGIGVFMGDTSDDAG